MAMKYLIKQSSLLRYNGINSCFIAKRLYSSDNKLTLSEDHNGIRVVTLNNSKKRNALSLEMIKSVKQHLVDNDDLRCIVVKSSGPVFSSGHDLGEMVAEKGRKYHEEIFQVCTEMMLAVQSLPVPVIAEVSGLATAAGCQFVASCDMAIAAESAKFATPGVSVGLFCSTPGIPVARAVPRKIAMDMLFTGHPIDAKQALSHGLVSRVVSDDQLETETLKIAHRICETSKSVNALGKRFFYRQINMPLEQAYLEGGAVMCDNLQMVDGQEGIKAFLEKRPPVWSHSDEKIDK